MSCKALVDDKESTQLIDLKAVEHLRNGCSDVVDVHTAVLAFALKSACDGSGIDQENGSFPRLANGQGSSVG
jgi:hypothetical protein